MPGNGATKAGPVGPEQFAVAVASVPWHVSRPLAVTVTPTPATVTMKLPLNCSDWPGASSSGPRTTLLETGWLLYTYTLVRTTSPMLVTEPVNSNNPPTDTDSDGHCSEIEISGVLSSGH